MQNRYGKSTEDLCKALLSLQNEEECLAFLEDICTIKEVQDMAQRLEAAMALSDGASYQEITQRISISTATIGRVNKCLAYGSGGYKAALSKLKEREEK